MAHKIILDTDPGIDDAMAIFFAFQSPDIEVLGLTTVYGNVPVTMAAQNARTLIQGPPKAYQHLWLLECLYLQFRKG